MLSYARLLEQVKNIDVERYAKTRNFYDGHVSGLSPFISRGVISPQRVKSIILSGNSIEKSKMFISELAWREYFQRIWWQHGEKILTDFYHTQNPTVHDKLIRNITEGTTSLEAIDGPIRQLLTTGRMHNHARMYVASLACNIGRAHWLHHARWMYYHLLDGDVASNSLSWQWVAGTFSNKKYYFNQENLNRFSGSTQTGTFIDCSYEQLESLDVPEELRDTAEPTLECNLPESTIPQLDYDKPLLVYNSYNLDPEWRAQESANRLLLLEPSHYQKFPVAANVLNFIVSTARTFIPGIQVFTGEFQEIPGLQMFSTVYFKEHRLSNHYQGHADKPDWMFPNIEPRGSFSSYWKLCEKELWRNR